MLSVASETALADCKELRDRQAGLLKRAKAYRRARLDEPEIDVESMGPRLCTVPPGASEFDVLVEQTLQHGLSRGLGQPIPGIDALCAPVCGKLRVPARG